MATLRWHEWIDRLVRWIKVRPWGWKAAGGLLGAWLASQFIDWVADDWLSQHVWTPILSFIKWLAARPVGYFGFAVAFVIAILLVLSFVETSALASRVWDKLWGSKQRSLDDLRRALDAARGETRSHSWWRNWEMAPPIVRPLSDLEFKEAYREIAMLGTTLGDLANSLQGITEEIITRLGTTDLGKYACVAFHNQYVGPTQRLLALVRDPGDEDPRGVFVAFFEKYTWFREWMIEIVQAQGLQFSAYAAYPKWRNADVLFFQRVRGMPMIPVLSEVTSAISRVGYPLDLPPPSTLDTGVHP